MGANAVGKRYNVNGLAGCVQQRRARSTGYLVGVYHGEQSGMEVDPADPWATVCEEHSTLVMHHTLADAKYHAVRPEWCEKCQAEMDKKGI